MPAGAAAGRASRAVAGTGGQRNPARRVKGRSQAVVCGNGILVRSPLRTFPGCARAGRRRVSRAAVPV
ncbi:hypothetical protein EMIT0111MI5_130069 [Burkholderia sp. IT-111MI5]